MEENKNRTDRQGNQTGSQSGNPRNQQLQREQTRDGASNQRTRSKDGDQPRRRRRSGGEDKNLS